MSEFMNAIIRRIASLARNEEGSAMTEFVIGLPVFVLIFSGMGMLYRINQEALFVKAEANALLWEDAELDLNAVGMVPIVGAATSVSSIGDLAQNGVSGLGIYADSGVKTSIPLALVPGTFRNTPCFSVGCALGNSDPTLFSWNLLNDNAADGIVNGNLGGGSGPAVLNSILTGTGSRPGIVAGIRYNTIEGQAPDRDVQTNWGDLTFQPGKLDMPATTVPTHRILAVGLTRAQFADDEVFDDQIPEFNSEFTLNSSQADVGDDCAQAGDAYEQCVDAGPTGESDSDAHDRCGSIMDNSSCGDLEGSGALGDIEIDCSFPGC